MTGASSSPSPRTASRYVDPALPFLPSLAYFLSNPHALLPSLPPSLPPPQAVRAEVLKNLDRLDEGALTTLNSWMLKVQDDKGALRLIPSLPPSLPPSLLPLVTPSCLELLSHLFNLEHLAPPSLPPSLH